MMKKRTGEKGELIFEEVSSDSQSSIEIGQSATGKTTWRAKVYCDDPSEMDKKLGEYIALAKKHAESN